MQIPNRLQGTIAVVTGAGHGIGRATATRLAREGAHVVVTGRRLETAEGTAAAIRADGLACSVLECDVADPGAVDRLAEAVLGEHGRIDILVNNAGVMLSGTVVTQTLEEWDLHYAFNIRGVVLGCRAFVPAMQRQGSGAIVNVGSISGTIGDPGLAAYDASKAAVAGLTRQLAVEYARDGIRVNCVCPGWIDTGFNDQIFADEGMTSADVAAMVDRFVPMNRQGTGDDIAAGIAYLCSADAAYVTGQTLVIDGGLLAQ
jgi:meso-butanediol dehydrogenase / (S,S)-butanediol dehydrogenase / diacetyl reductase